MNSPKKARKLLIDTTRFTPNWLARRPVNPVRLSLLAGMVSLVAALVACEEPKDIGLPPNTEIGVLYTDTLTIRTSTIQLDSVLNDRNVRLLVGQYNDPVFGKVSARAFGQLAIRSNTGSFKTEGEMVYDSVRALLPYTYIYGDTTSVQTISIHQLTEDLDSTKRYVASSSAAYATQPLATLQLTPTAANDAKYVRLPDALGREFLNRSKGSGITQADFTTYFKGIAVIPAATNTTVFGFSNNIYFELYYHSSTDTTKRYRQDFSTTTGRASFSQIRVDRSGTKLAGLSVGRPLSASATGGELFVQSASGVTPKLEFPTLLNLRKETGRIAINRAELSFSVTGNSPGGPIPPYMTLAQVDENNRVLYTSEGSAGNRLFHMVQRKEGTFQTTGKWYYPQVAGYNSRLKTYTFDVTTYLQAILVGFTPNNGLVLFPPSTSELVTQSTTSPASYVVQPYIFNQLNGAVLGGEKPVKLVVFYTYTP
ncbi:DUF4270 family protein [Larkinella sp. VNQ87]|uniref:DUF4270 family protein n=1 Tax=Larkinella sp. VNQ87 TaxID=3400921 RepID=UPI003BFD8CB7